MRILSGIISRVAGGDGFVPSDLSGCHCWMDAGDGATVFSDDSKTTESTEGGAVAVWEDQSGGGNDLTQTSSSFRPVYRLSDGSIQITNAGGTTVVKVLNMQDMSSFGACSFFGRLEVQGASNGGIWGLTALNSTQTAAHWNYSLNGTKTVFFGTDTGGQGNAHTDWNTGGVPAWDAKMSFMSSTDTDGTTIETANGVEIFDTDMGGPSFRTVPYLGCVVRGGIAQYGADTKFYKFAVFSRVLNGTEQGQMATWLAS